MAATQPLVNRPSFLDHPSVFDQPVLSYHQALAVPAAAVFRLVLEVPEVAEVERMEEA